MFSTRFGFLSVLIYHIKRGVGRLFWGDGSGVMGAQGDTGKLRNLILYVSGKSKDDPKFGSMKLNKLLFFADFYFYRKTGEMLTGEVYQKIQKGPAPRAMYPLLEDMQAAKELKLEGRWYVGLQQKRPVALIDPDLGLFSSAELETADEVIQKFKDLNGSEISDAAYAEFNLGSFIEKESIPYNIAIFDNTGFTSEELEWATKYEQELAGFKNAGGQTS